MNSAVFEPSPKQNRPFDESFFFIITMTKCDFIQDCIHFKF